MKLRRHAASLVWAALGLLLLGLHALAAAAGWADAASALSGTPVAAQPGQASAVLGAAYVALRLAAFVVAPTLLLAALLRPVWLALLSPRAPGGAA